eukprot:TRINITY_DN32605_c0_g1_i1.p1 TRINITY_DN32605_c0_g1~~TRINITY_DN32605_c0_g1_i1.p1  ORF type:complete len:154 (+),score=44.17 TRINITY_DN32605_c0_g1_i1:126-587(+)
MFLSIFFFFKQKTAYEMLRSLVGSEMCIRDRYQRRVRETACPLMLWLVSLLTLCVGASIVHVDSHTGSDDAPGTRAQPFRTMARALSATRRLPGSNNTILLGPGSYYTNSTIILTSQDDGLTIEGAGWNRTILSGGMVPVSYTHLTLPTKRIV